ncbi:adenylate/guanylate cyclase domain-containing protein [Trichocoleus sp. DQ-U1]|uniref:GAF domain-containing protein n=1 Tax=Trichocoleus sp. DQ-U1 TaxID=2933926 RepID=UPI00329A6893
MTPSSTKMHGWNDTDRVIDVVPHDENQTGNQIPQTSTNIPTGTGGALATKEGSFTALLAPLNKETFKEVVTGVEEKLQVVNQTLSMLTDSQGFDAILQEMLNAITLKTGELLGADRTTIYLLDEEKNQLWSILAEGAEGRPLELRIPADKGIAGEVATHKKSINIPFDFYEDPRSAFAKKKDQENGYRTYTMLTLPLVNEEGNLVAVVQLINKLNLPNQPGKPLGERIDLNGFTSKDERIFAEFAPSIRLILESSRSFYMATQRQRASDALMKATRSLSQSNLDLEDTLNRVMHEAQELMNADRSTLWLLDSDRHDLWTRIPLSDGSMRELRVPVGKGYVGKVAESGKPLNISFDLYADPDSEVSKQVDQANGYRTCSLLCMPIFNADKALIGVTQLVNKKKQGEFPPYNPETWPEPPECWKASFNQSDEAFMEAFNIQAGVALQNAKLFATVKQQEQMQRDILRSLSNGVLSTDKSGQIIAANESAKRLLGFKNEDHIEGRKIADLIRIKEGDFSKWFKAAIDAAEEKSRQQYYPDQTLLSTEEEQHSVHLSINSIADASDNNNVYGALVVMDDISQEKRLKSTMYRYMTQELAEQLINSGDAKLGGDKKEVSILFSDIRSYTTLTESMNAEDVVQMLNEYFESMVDAVFTHKGTLDKYIGDAIMAVFGSPLPLPDHAWMSVQTAVEMRHRLTEFNACRQDIGFPTFKIGIGINSGTVISGNIGSSKRMEFTAIGDEVNLGSRLEGASKQYGCDIVISESTYQPCKNLIWARELDCIRVKGKTTPVNIYELVGLRDEKISDQKQMTIELYHKGREYYLNRKFTRAMGEFGTILEEIDKNDKAAALHLKRCQLFLQEPPPDNWDGVFTLTEK